MNARVVPATSPPSPGKRDGVRGRLGAVLFAPVAALALLGLALTGAVLLVAAVGPPALAVLGLVQELQERGNDPGGKYLLGALTGLACCPLIVLPPCSAYGGSRCGRGC